MKRFGQWMLAGVMILNLNTFVSSATEVPDEQITISSPENHFSFSNGIIVKYLGEGGDVVIPSTINGETVIGIGDNAFEYAYHLTSVTIPDTVIHIGYRSFMACRYMTSVNFGNSVQSIGQQAFWSCDSLSTLQLPDSLITLEARSFEACANLNSITFGNSLQSIGDTAFGACGNISLIILPNSLQSLGKQTFALCNRLTYLYIPSTVAEIGENLLNYVDGDGNIFSVNGVIVYGETGSLAEEYALNSGLSFVSKGKIATPSTAKVMVNGEVVPFGAYQIEGFNYFKLTDLSYALNGTSRQFEVTWDPELSAISMKTQLPHFVLGTELQGNTGKNEIAEEFTSTVYQNSNEIDVTVYTINGSSYFKLDSLKDTLDLNVGWDGETSTITINA